MKARKEPPTFFAPAYRKSVQDVAAELARVQSDEQLMGIMEALPLLAAILNEERQVVYANQALLKMMNLTDSDAMHPRRMGELLFCAHATTEAGGCGTAEACRYCGALLAVLKSRKTRSRVVEDVRFTTDEAHGSISYDFSVSAAPYAVGDQQYSLITVNDQGDQKRRRILERIFFHDVINTAGSLTGYLNILTNSLDLDQVHEGLEIARNISLTLVDHVLGQRQLLDAENGELKVLSSEVDSYEVLQQAIREIQHHTVSFHRHVSLHPGTPSAQLKTDPTLLNRVLINMLKNALEAEPKGEIITAGCQLLDGAVKFWVHNPTFIPRKIQLQVFQRSFSTKGSNRGLGTYSIRLLGEQYLGGKVGFETDQTIGTIFHLTLPL